MRKWVKRVLRSDLEAETVSDTGSPLVFNLDSGAAHRLNPAGVKGLLDGEQGVKNKNIQTCVSAKRQIKNVILIQIDESAGRHQTASVFGKMIHDDLFALQFVDTTSAVITNHRRVWGNTTQIGFKSMKNITAGPGPDSIIKIHPISLQH